MRASSDRTWLIRVAVVMLLVSALLVAGMSAMIPPLHVNAIALDDDEGGEELEEDDDRGNGNDEDGDDDDNPGQGKDKKDKDKKSKDDDEGDFVTVVPTHTPVVRAEPTRPALTRVSTATPTATTGTLIIRLQVCLSGTDPAIGARLLSERCTDGQADADFELTGRSGFYNGWRRTATTGADGEVMVKELTAGTYHLTLNDIDWCAAEASSVNDGLLAIEPGQTTEVTAYLCDDPDDATTAGS